MTTRFRRALLGIVLLSLAGCQTVPDRGRWTGKQTAALRAEGFIDTPRGWEFGMSDRLLFATDDSSILAAQATIITRIARHLVAVDIRHASVEGHTDTTGSARHNDALSVRRAAAVADALDRGGLERRNIVVVGLGERYPVESNATASGRRENRRVVILITAP